MDAAFNALGDATIRTWYLYFCLALMVLPLIALSVWYHSRIKRTKGGGELMERQAETPPLQYGLGSALRNMFNAGGMASDVVAGKYGAEAKSLTIRAWWFCGVWAVAVTIAFGVLIWADEVNRAAN